MAMWTDFISSLSEKDLVFLGIIVLPVCIATMISVIEKIIAGRKRLKKGLMAAFSMIMLLILTPVTVVFSLMMYGKDARIKDRLIYLWS